ncbi:endonuclease/exonuclease/phosphatase family protein [bacterium]|nr:endonuclease/exonuclease/phosphatase family protein [bacterium]
MPRRPVIIVTALSLLLCVFAAVAHLWYPAGLTAFTVLPAWGWAVPGIILGALAFRRRQPLFAIITVGLWLVYVLVFAEEARSLGRALLPSRSDEQVIRVVSLNCAGDKRAAAEVEVVRPDIVLLQEVPPRSSVAALARQLWGGHAGVAWETDTAIITRGEILNTDAQASATAHLIQARIRLPGAGDIHAISLRLAPAPVRFDLWNPACWSSQAVDRRHRREWLERIARQVSLVPERIPVLVGGDFNAPAGDAVYRVLRPRLSDAFAVAGTGWGNTLANDLPLVRIDQIWVSNQIQSRRVVARKTQYSHHRMVVGDLIIAAAH